MTLPVCSLANGTAQSIPVSDDYTLLRYPYGSGAGSESYDADGMHQPTYQGQSVSYSDPKSGLIWPSVAGWGLLYAMVFWDSASSWADSDEPTEYRARFVRDPLNLSTGYDSTATTDDAKTPGGQYKTYHWGMFVHPETPVGFMVRHNGKKPLAVTFTEFKLVILPNDLWPLPSPAPSA